MEIQSSDDKLIVVCGELLYKILEILEKFELGAHVVFQK